MIVEILCIGDELLSGITLNTNAHWLCSEITNVGGVVRRVTIVRDEISEISSATRESLARNPGVLITTGGLGATYDDMTLEGVAVALDKKVVLDNRAVKMLKKSYAIRKLHYELTKFAFKDGHYTRGLDSNPEPCRKCPCDHRAGRWHSALLPAWRTIGDERNI